MSIRDFIGGRPAEGAEAAGQAASAQAASAQPAAARPNALVDALGQVAAFPPGRAAALFAEPAILAAAAQDEAASGRIALDGRGLSAGERLAVLQPARHFVAEWRNVRAAFDVAIKPAMPDIEAASALEAEAAALERRVADDLAAVDRRAENDHAWRETRDRYAEARARFDASRLAHANRDANMRSHHPLYWGALVLVGAAEWLINYDTLVMFFGIPAMAIGATAILAFAMAFASHAHGIVWKQWSHRFGRHRSALQRAADYRLLGIGTLSLLFVLLFAGFSRFSVVMHQAQAGPAQNILGAEAQVTFDPSRDVLISMLANLLAWLVGAFVSFLCHDEDPDHMAATSQFNRWQSRFLKVERPYREERELIAARAERELAQARSSAEARRARVRPQADMLAQVEAHELAILRAVHAAVMRNLATYRAALADAAVRTGAVISVDEGDAANGAARALDVHALRTMPHQISVEDVRAFA